MFAAIVIIIIMIIIDLSMKPLSLPPDLASSEALNKLGELAGGFGRIIDSIGGNSRSTHKHTQLARVE